MLGVSLVSAYTVTSLAVDPKGALVPGTSVNVTIIINNPPRDSNNFPDATNIEMSSALWNPTWKIFLFSDRGSRPLPEIQRTKVTLADWDLVEFNQNLNHEQISVKLSGHAPDVDYTGNKTIFEITQLDARSNPIANSTSSVEGFIINTGCCKSPLTGKRADLQIFRSHIDEKASMGIDTYPAEMKHHEAKTSIDKASALPSTQYSAALSYLNNATWAITDGELSLDRAWAEKKVADAQVPLDRSDEIISWFKGNKSTADMAGLQPILAKRDLAADSLSRANNELLAGNYSTARSYAILAYQSANETYHDAKDFQLGACACVNYWGPYAPVNSERNILFGGGCILGFVLIVAGIFWWKKNRRE